LLHRTRSRQCLLLGKPLCQSLGRLLLANALISLARQICFGGKALFGGVVGEPVLLGAL